MRCKPSVAEEVEGYMRELMRSPAGSRSSRQGARELTEDTLDLMWKSMSEEARAEVTRRLGG